MSATTDPQGSAPPTLATAGLPARVRRALERVLRAVSLELETGLNATLNDLEQELFRLADRARSGSIESVYLQSLRAVRHSRADLLPRMLLILEGQLAAIRRAPPKAEADAPQPIDFRNLRLVDDRAIEEDTRLNELAVRQEARAALPLHLLGQRFGVLAGSPAFDAERLPVGPRALCRALRDACRGLHLEEAERDLLYSTFDRHVLARYPAFAEDLDQTLAREGILPGLTYVPIRTQPRPQRRDVPPAASADGKPVRRVRRAERTPAAADPEAPYIGWLGVPAGEAPAARAPADSANTTPPARAGAAEPALEVADENAFENLRKLLAGRRQLIQKLGSGRGEAGTPVGTTEVLGALDAMRRAVSPTGTPQGSLADIRQMVLAQARQRHGARAALLPADNDAFELLGLLYRHLEGEVRSDAPAAELIRRLQVPLLQVALRDHAFFVRPHHPARELLNTVAEAAAKWLGEDDFDPQLLAPLQQAVSQVVKDYDGDLAVFEASNKQLQGQLEAMARKAELLERRHIEAARGKERLELAKRQAGETLARLIGERTLPKFTRALLNQAWCDVLTLTLLRQGEDSVEWQKQVDATARMIEACSAGSGEADPALVALIERSLKQVGHHDEEANAIAVRLAGGREHDDDDAATRTELAIKLKARARLGEETARAGKAEMPPRTPAEQARYDQLRALPFGTWFEFVTNQQGDVVRRRLSWFSTVSDHALFVNARGQRVAEMSMDALARMMAAGQARLVTAGRARLVDRAWQAALATLRSLTGGNGNSEPSRAGGVR